MLPALDQNAVDQTKMDQAFTVLNRFFFPECAPETKKARRLPDLSFASHAPHSASTSVVTGGADANY
jgi:hypothetical protein